MVRLGSVKHVVPDVRGVIGDVELGAGIETRLAAWDGRHQTLVLQSAGNVQHEITTITYIYLNHRSFYFLCFISHFLCIVRHAFVQPKTIKRVQVVCGYFTFTCLIF